MQEPKANSLRVNRPYEKLKGPASKIGGAKPTKLTKYGPVT